MDERTIRNLLFGNDRGSYRADDLINAGLFGSATPRRDINGLGGVANNNDLPIIMRLHLLAQQQRMQQSQPHLNALYYSALGTASLPAIASAANPTATTAAYPSIYELDQTNMDQFGVLSAAGSSYLQNNALRAGLRGLFGATEPAPPTSYSTVTGRSGLSDRDRILLEALQQQGRLALSSDATASLTSSVGGGVSSFVASHNDPYSAAVQSILSASERVAAMPALPAVRHSPPQPKAGAVAHPAAEELCEDGERLTGHASTTTSSSKRSRVSSHSASSRDKPKRPLSAYNIFFKEERVRLLSTINTESEDLVQNKKGGSQKKSVSCKKGKISFENLAKIIGGRWRDLGSSQVDYYKQKANADMQRYRKEMEEYNMKQLRKKGEEDDHGCDKKDEYEDEEVVHRSEKGPKKKKKLLH
ncbi:hypothetical protein ACA910_021395 [Epithemia clementina (nom. ined.)]